MTASVINLGTIVETASFAVVLLCYAVMKWSDRRAERRRLCAERKGRHGRVLSPDRTPTEPPAKQTLVPLVRQNDGREKFLVRSNPRLDRRWPEDPGAPPTGASDSRPKRPKVWKL